MNHDECRWATFTPNEDGGIWACFRCGTPVGAEIIDPASGYVLVGLYESLVALRKRHGDLPTYGISAARMTKHHGPRSRELKLDWYANEIFVYCSNRAGGPNDCGVGQHLNTRESGKPHMLKSGDIWRRVSEG
jgi:hypothetical protein